MPKYIIPYQFLGKPNSQGVRSRVGKKHSRTVDSGNLGKAYQAMYAWSHRQGKKIHLFKGNRVKPRKRK